MIIPRSLSVQVLSDPQKRRQYDLYGPEEASNGFSSGARRHRSNGGFYEYDPTHGFEAEMTPEEIFNMFFGGGYPSQTVFMRRGGGASHYRRQAHFQRQFHAQQQYEVVLESTVTIWIDFLFERMSYRHFADSFMVLESLSTWYLSPTDQRLRCSPATNAHPADYVLDLVFDLLLA